MDLFIIELVCWGGLLFFFWALKDGLSRVESDIESMGILSSRKVAARKGPVQYYKPETAHEQIGSYRDQPIYRYVMIDGQTYQFDRVFPPGSASSISEDERCVAPGLIYLACRQCDIPLAQA